MAKTKNEEVVETTNSATPAVIKGEGGKEISVNEILKQVEEAEVGMELGADYFKIEPGEIERVVFLEMTEINGLGDRSHETSEAVKLLGKDGRFKINADKVLVSTCRALASKGRTNVPLQITCKGMIKGPKGSYRDLMINELILK